MKRKKQFVRYRVICYETGRVLALGQKQRDISDLYYIGRFISFLHIGRCWERVAVINGVTCLIQYWTTLRRFPCNIVVQGGAELGLSGRSYSENDYYCENEVTV